MASSADQASEIARLRRELDRARMERDILKKPSTSPRLRLGQALRKCRGEVRPFGVAQDRLYRAACVYLAGERHVPHARRVAERLSRLAWSGTERANDGEPGAEVVDASAAGGDVPSEDLTFAHTIRLADAARCDLICVQGGASATEIALYPAFVDEVRHLGEGARYVTSVCTGSLILGAARLLKGRRAACHWGWATPPAAVRGGLDDGRVAGDGPVIAGSGVTAAIDFAVTVLAEIGGTEAAQTIQLGLAERPDTAPPAAAVGLSGPLRRNDGAPGSRSASAAERLGLDQEYYDGPPSTAAFRHGRCGREGTPRRRRLEPSRSESGRSPTRRTASGGTVRSS